MTPFVRSVKARRAVAILAAAVLASAVSAPLAGADADPASDVLLGASVFYPYSTPVSSQLQKTLNTEIAAAGRADVPIKVALIGSPVDLGGIPAVFGKPEQYARFLDEELSFNGRPPLLVVMPGGYGVSGLSPAATAAAAALGRPAGSQSNELARAALEAIPKLAAASGHPIASVATVSTSASSSSGGTGLAIAAVGAVAAAAAAALVLLRRRRAPVH